MKRLTTFAWHVVATALVAVPLTGVAGTDNLPDPTLPPAVLAAPDAASGATQSGPVLQSVLQSSGRKIAVISGQAVRVGEKLGDATLVKVSDQEAVLRSDDGTLQTLKIHPAVEKKIIITPRATTSKTHQTKRPAPMAVPNQR